MKWIAISGSWRYYSEALEFDVRDSVNKILSKEHSIVTGGALGVDYYATDEILKHEFIETRVKIFLPTSLTIYIEHYRKRALEGVITFQQTAMLEEQLLEVKERYPFALVENFDFTSVSRESYYERNKFIVNVCDELMAFHVNNTQGTLDAINKAIELGKKVRVIKYTIPQEKIA